MIASIEIFAFRSALYCFRCLFIWPYGELWSAPVASKTTKKFTTYQRDQESGLDYAEARYFASNNGRFNSPDPGEPELENPQSLNRYVYTTNDPINYTDPTGKGFFSFIKKIFAKIFGGGSGPQLCGPGFVSIGGGCGPIVPIIIVFIPPTPTEPPPCDPGWITGNMTDPSGKEFTAADLNIAARAIYGEASGRAPAAERDAVASVIYNRVGASGYPGESRIHLKVS